MATASTNDWASIRRTLRNRDYTLYQGGRFAYQVGNWMYKVAIGWIVWDLTGSAAWLGIFAFLDQGAALVTLPFAGTAADRFNNMKFMRSTQALISAQSASLGLLAALDLLSIWILAAFVVSYGVLTSGQQPTNHSIVPKIVPREDLAAAFGFHSMVFNISRFIGPMLAGYVLVVWGAWPAILGHAVGAALFSVGLALMRLQTPAGAGGKAGHEPSNGMIADFREGIAYAFGHPGIGPLMIVLIGVSFVPYSIELLLPSLADGVYHMGAAGLAWMTSLLAAGAVAVGVVVAGRGTVAGLSTFMVGSIVAMAVALMALAFAGSFMVGLACMFALGFAFMGMRAVTLTLVQYNVDPSKRGRVAALYGIIGHSLPAVGALTFGALGDRFGIPLIVGVVGMITAVIAGVALYYRSACAAWLEGQPVADAKPRAAE